MKTGRNDPCPCGSGKKYKHCCMHLDRVRSTSPQWRRMERVAEKLSGRLATHAERFYGPDWLTDAWRDFTLGDGPPFDEDAFYADTTDEDDAATDSTPSWPGAPFHGSPSGPMLRILTRT